MKKHNYGIQKGDILMCLLPLPKGIVSKSILVAQSLKKKGGKYSHAVLCKSNKIGIDSRGQHNVKYIPISHYVNGDYDFMIKRPKDQTKVNALVKYMESDIGKKKYAFLQNILLLIYLIVYKLSFRKIDLFKIFPYDLFPDNVECVEAVVSNCRKANINVKPEHISSCNFLPVDLQLDTTNFTTILEKKATS